MTSQQFFHGTEIAVAPRAYSPGTTGEEYQPENRPQSQVFRELQPASLRIELRINHAEELAEECRIAMQMRVAIVQMWTRFFALVSQGRLEHARQELRAIRNIIETPVRAWTEGADLCATDGDYEPPRLMPKTKMSPCFAWTHQATDAVMTIAFAENALDSGDQYRIDESVADVEIAVLGLLTRILKECRPGAKRPAQHTM